MRTLLCVCVLVSQTQKSFDFFFFFCQILFFISFSSHSSSNLRLRQTRQNLVDSKALIHIRKCFFFLLLLLFFSSLLCVVNELLEKCFKKLKNKTHRPAESRVSLLRRRLLSQVTFPPRGIFDMLWTRSQKRSNCHSVCVCVCAVGFAL